ncbi:MAG: plasmid pRiA4b ORF-3 family protein [Levilactobacillus sp.]|uniref:plasmid pRiA4b ORF-3 family protein n=1 Tax=Levilactobacillus sp. TaxID=2767919 RepID=UPI00258BB4D5|nr:plasmid pRiA4b ORF-3 family protein [Levilactobacillus sp.]MCI1553078.1 plasmid pRiA4b ORF-3 family protein [Levilactobacillus sp.]MCI1598733.1 plasmid pRiA4b ORF-3 family protein [Levilactobacillus sp.]MCI1605082.1 plasmid pRiA4b ORF-3 family protein [Levilactobacillus sp.]
MPEKPIAMEITIKLKDVRPATWRTLLVPIDIRYDQLHVLLQLAFGWENEHLYGFWPKGKREQMYVQSVDEWGDSADMPASQGHLYTDVAVGPVIYEYDFGDSWEHVITLKHLLTATQLAGRQLPSCVRGSGANRLEDARGKGVDGQGDRYNREAVNLLLAHWKTAEKAMNAEKWHF